MLQKSSRRSTPLLLALSLAVPATGHGAGFALIEQSVTGLGNAFAGGAASAEDVTTVYFNPAGLTRLSGSQWGLGGHVVAPTAEFSNDGTSSVGGAVPIAGGNGGDGGVIKLAPNFYYVRDLSDDLKFGLGVNAPFGLATDYDAGWVGRYHALKSELITLNVNPSLAARLGPGLSIGGGVDIQYVEAELSQAIDYPTVCGGLAARGLPTASCAGLPTSNDGQGTVEGDDWSVGFNLGALYEFDDRTRVGAAYRSKLDHDLEGDARFTNTPAALQAINMFVDTGASAAVTLPESLSVSAYHDLTPRLALMGDITWTRWDRFDELRVSYDSAQPDSVTPEEWDNSRRYAVGLSYRYTPQWTLRTGFAYDETPIPSAQLRTPRIPGNSRRWLALGASYRGAGSLQFDVGYAHLFISDPAISNVNSTGALLSGTYDAAVDIFSAQIRGNF